MKRLMVFAISAALLFVAATQAAAQTADTDIFGIELGQVIGYNFNNDNVGVGQLVAIQFGLAESMEVGFAFISGDPAPQDMPDFSLVRLTYFLQDSLAFRLSTGSGGTGGASGVAAGVGVVTSPFRRTVNDAFTTALNLSLEYLAPNVVDNNFDDGVLMVGITGKVAF